jgi:GT2 family glycosyltransferase
MDTGLTRRPTVSIVILNYNGLEDTKKCLRSILKTTYRNFRIFIVDNGSNKNEADKLKKIFSQDLFTFVRFSKNLGFTGGNNKILQKIKTKYVVLLNNDVEVTPRWLYYLIKLMEKNEMIAVAQPKILWSKNKKYFDYAGACGGFIDIFGYPFTRGRIFNTQEIDNGQYDSQCDIFWASGACTIIRNKALRKTGLLDESFFNYMEEIDLCFRMQKAGYRVVCEPRSVVYHKVASTASRNALKKRYWEHKNNILLIVKNYPLKLLMLILPFRLILENISIAYYIFRKEWVYAIAVLIAQLQLLYLIPTTLWKRYSKKKWKSQKSVNGLLSARSIVYAYFIQKKRKFSQL